MDAHSAMVIMKGLIYVLNLRKSEMKVHHLPGMGYDSNIFLVDGDEPFLVDAGTGSNREAVLAWLSETMDAESIERIILTHRHYDHVGGAAALSRALGARVMMHELDAAPVRDGDTRGTRAIMFGKEMEAVKVETLKEGNRVTSGDREFMVLHTPGHSIGSMTLFCEEDGTLISGDTVFIGGVGRWDLPTGDRGELVDSIRKLIQLDPKDLYPGHGPCSEGDARRHLRDALRYLGE